MGGMQTNARVSDGPTIYLGTFSDNVLFFCKFNTDPPLGEKWDKV